jgi:hypothetical protein
LLLKLFFGARASPAVLIGYLERMLECETAVLKELTGIEVEIANNQQYPDAPYWKMAARFGQFELQAHIRWAEETLAELNSIAARQCSQAESCQENQHAE